MKKNDKADKRIRLVKKARKHYIYFLGFTNPKNSNFEDPICFNGELLKILDTSLKRYNHLKNKICY